MPIRGIQQLEYLDASWFLSMADVRTRIDDRRISERQRAPFKRGLQSRKVARITTLHGPIAQLDRVPDYESGGRGFESSSVRHFTQLHLVSS